MLPVFTLSTYANVKTNLCWAAAVFLAVIEFFSLMWLFTPGQRDWVLHYGNQIGLSQVVSVAGVFVADYFFAYWLVTAFRVHELWDTYVSRWRRDYDVDFILPRLVEPFAAEISEQFAAKVRLQRDRAMSVLFYHFVRDEDPVIGKILIVRFYDAIFNYWVCQYVEIALALIVVELLALAAGDQSQGAAWTYLLPWIAGAVVLLVLNRIVIRSLVLPRVRARTGEEIDEIHVEHLPELQQQISKLNGLLGLSFHPTTSRNKPVSLEGLSRPDQSAGQAADDAGPARDQRTDGPTSPRKSH
jgi:hypothetical protein